MTAVVSRNRIGFTRTIKRESADACIGTAHSSATVRKNVVKRREWRRIMTVPLLLTSGRRRVRPIEEHFERQRDDVVREDDVELHVRAEFEGALELPELVGLERTDRNVSVDERHRGACERAIGVALVDDLTG